MILAGPTASGKSALALALARRIGGVIINADAMQTYRDLRVLTARPTPAAERAVPHMLYGVRDAAEPASAGWWRKAALAAMAEARAAGKVPILCGGSGLYLETLVKGIAAVPDPPPAARVEARALLARLGSSGLYALLAEADPQTAVRLRPNDSQRLARAFEVWLGTGRGLAAWQAEGAEKPPWHFRVVLLDPPRPDLSQAIEERFAAMLAADAVAEVQALLARGLDPSLPVFRAHGVTEISAFLAGHILLEEVQTRAVAAIRRYVKRQATWLRHHPLAESPRTRRIATRIVAPEQLSDQELEELVIFLRKPG